MKRAIVTAFLVLGLAAGALSQAKPGGVARMISMGGALYGSNTVLNPYVYKDPAWILLNPAYQSMYRDYVWLNVAGGGVTGANGAENTASSQFGGLNVALNKTFTLGVLLNYDPSYANTIGGTGGMLSNFINIARPGRLNPVVLVQPVGAPPPVASLEALATFRLDEMHVGVGVQYGWTSKDGENTSAASSTTGEIGTNVIGIRAGMVWDIGSGNSFDANAAFRMANASDSYTVSGTAPATGTSEYKVSSTDLGVNLRGRFRLSNRVGIVPIGAFRMISAEPKEEAILTGQTATVYSITRSSLSVVAGLGAEYTTRVFYLAGGLAFATSSMKDEETNRNGANTGSITTTTGSTAFPVINIGGEWHFTDWMDGRLGYYRSLGSDSRKVETSQTQTMVDGSLFNPSSIVSISGYGPIPDNSLVTLGVGIHFDGFALDATVSEEALRRGLGLLGSGDSINTFGYITLSYSFE
jgi:hypothetical protein